MKTEIDNKYEKMVMEIVREISDNLQQEWKGVDDPVREEIEQEWGEIIKNILKKVGKHNKEK